MTYKHRCPICHRAVQQTRSGCIAGHYDTAHAVCPASFRDFDITITDRPTPPTKPAA